MLLAGGTRLRTCCCCACACALTFFFWFSPSQSCAYACICHHGALPYEEHVASCQHRCLAWPTSAQALFCGTAPRVDPVEVCTPVKQHLRVQAAHRCSCCCVRVWLLWSQIDDYKLLLDCGWSEAFNKDQLALLARYGLLLLLAPPRHLACVASKPTSSTCCLQSGGLLPNESPSGRVSLCLVVDALGLVYRVLGTS